MLTRRIDSLKPLATMLFIVAVQAVCAPVHAAASSVYGRVVDPNGMPLPGVTVTLTPSTGGGSSLATLTDEVGAYRVEAAPGRYRITAELAGFAPASRGEIALEEAPLLIELSLSLAAFGERVTVTAAPAVAMLGTPAPDAPVTITRQVIVSAMLPNSQYDDVLPLMPNVIRGADGLISVAGARASQGTLLVNGVNQTDPITGGAGVMLPIEAVDAVQVYAGNFPAAFGRATGGVTSVVTHAGADTVHASANSFFPRLLFADGGIHGVEFWEPNGIVSGPLITGRAHYEQALSYRYDRNRFETLSGPQEDRFTALLSWTQIDLQVSPGHHVTATASADPQNTDRANVTAFTPAETVPSLAQGGWSATVADRAAIGNAATLELRGSMLRTKLQVTPQGTAPYMLGHDSTQGNYFDELSLHGQRTELAAVYTSTAAPHHLLTIGFSFGRAAFDGTDDSRPVDLLRSDDTLSRRITFGPATEVAAATVEVAGYAQDTWTAASWMTLSTGVRFDRATAAAGATLHPRFGVTIAPAHRRTSVSGSIGLFADKLPLEALAFPSFPVRSVQAFDRAGMPEGPPSVSVNVLDGRLRTPSASRWEVGIDQRYDAGWLAHVQYQERHGRDEAVVTLGGEGSLLLSSTGAAIARSLEITGGYRAPRAGHQVYVSYVRSSTQGDLNTVDAIAGPFKEPFIQPNAVGPLPTDVPHRLLAWGLIALPARVTVAPFLEVRRGFPYSAIDDDWVYSGARDSFRLPWAASFDIYVNTIVHLPRRLPDARIGLKIYNLAGNVSRDVQRDIARPDFGTTYNSLPRDFSFVFELLWGHR